MGKNIQLKASDGHQFDAYVAEPAGKPRGLVIVAPEIFGVNSHIRSVAMVSQPMATSPSPPLFLIAHKPNTKQAIHKLISVLVSSS